MPGKLAIVTTHFNPCGYEALRRNYRRFAEHVADSGGELWTIEVALGESPCFLPPGPHIVQLRSDSVLWHKEAALNSLIERLPPEYDKVAWIDADVLFDRADWIHAIRRELEKVPVIQCFSEAILLDAEGRVECRLESIVKRASAFPSNPFSSAGGYGYAWAARRSAIEQTGLFALDMAGGGDTFMTLGWLDRRDHPLLPVISPELRTSFEEWSERAWPHVFGGVGWIDGAVRHLFHGSAGNRQHYERAGCLADHRFDPNVHLERDADGLVRWTEAGRTLERDIAKFFRIRREDDQLADDAIRRPVLQTFEFEDCLRRAEVVVRMPKPKARCCVATIATSGFEKWLERMLASLAKNGQIDDALRVVFVPESDLENRRIAERYGAVPVLCRPRLGCDSAIKSVLYSAPLAIDAELFLCLDADIVVFGELESLFAKVASNPGRISIVRNSGQPAYNSLREMVATFYRGQVVDLDRLCPGGSRHADFPLVVNDGVFASDRATLLAVDSCLRQMPAAADYVDEHHVRNQLLFNLALAELDCSLEMPARYNVQLHSDRIEMRSTPSGMRPFHDGKPVRLLHFTGESKRTSPFRDIDF